MTALGWWYLSGMILGGLIGGSLVYLFCSNKQKKSHHTIKTKTYSSIDRDTKETD